MRILLSRNGLRHAIWLTAVALFAILFLLWPAFLVFQAALVGRNAAEPGLTTSSQQVSLAVQTGKLVLSVLAIALPVGVTMTLLIFRTDLPWQWVWRVLMLLPGLVPLDLHATAWLAAVGPQGLGKSLGMPIELKGLVGAAWVHAMASIAWVVAFVAPAVCSVEAELEEDCLLAGGPIRTMWHVTMRRALGAIIAAALIVSVQTAGEMAVTDLLQVRTYAETVYTEFAIASRVGAATATAVPGLFVWCALVAAAGLLLVRSVPQNTQALFARRPVFRLAIGRPIALAGTALVVAATWGVPTASLVWRAGLKFPRVIAGQQGLERDTKTRPDSIAKVQSSKPHWSPSALRENLARSAESAGEQLELSLKVAAATAIVVIPSAWLLISFAQTIHVGPWFLGAITCLLIALPGPVLGIGLKLAEGQLLSGWGNGPASMVGRLVAPWHQLFTSWLGEPAPAILVWMHTLRALPFAIAVLWPVRRLVNRRLLEAAAIDGAGAWARFRFVEFPCCRPAILAAAFITCVISIGELSGSVMVTPPGQQLLSVRIFTLAHYGLESHLAGICLLLLGVSTAGAVAALACFAWSVRSLKDVRDR